MRRDPGRVSDRQRIVNFIEELGWLLKQYEDIQWGEMSKVAMLPRHPSMSRLQSFAPENPNIAFLIGILPGLFLDRNHFPSNKDIAMFAERVLEVPILRHGKKSQSDLVGHIICSLANAEDKRLETVAVRLRNMLLHKDPAGIKSMMDSWTKAIDKMSPVEKADE